MDDDEDDDEDDDDGGGGDDDGDGKGDDGGCDDDMEARGQVEKNSSVVYKGIDEDSFSLENRTNNRKDTITLLNQALVCWLFMFV